MVTRSKILDALAYLIFGLLLSNCTNSIKQDTFDYNTQLPIRSMEITIDPIRRNDFFDAIKFFAEKHGFAIRIAKIHPDYEDYTIQMYRSDYKLYGSNPFLAEVFDLSFYEMGPHTREIPSSYLDLLMNDFKNIITGVPNSKFIEIQENN